MSKDIAEKVGFRKHLHKVQKAHKTKSVFLKTCKITLHMLLIS